MSDEKRYNGEDSIDELEESLEDLLSLAFKKKETGKSSGLDFKFAAKNEPVSEKFDTSDFYVDDIVNEANASKEVKTDDKEDVFSATVRRIRREEPSESEFIPVSQEDEVQRELSIEEMVANAMTVKKGGKTRAVERVATEEDALSDEELKEILANDEMYNQYLANNEDYDEDDEKPKWYQNKYLITGLLVLAVFLTLVGIVLAVFLDYADKVKDKTVYTPNAGVQDPVSPDDTVDAVDYEEWLKNQLSGIADNAMSNENVTNILIIAEDLRDTTGDSRGNTDVMILASINKEKETLTLTSFMRDIYCDIPGFYASRLNSAYAKGGPQVLMDTLKSNFGIVVENYVLINFYSFIDVVEAIGGIEADVTQAHINAMRDPLSEQNDILGNKYGTDFIKEPGHYVLNGNQALAYSRIRYGVGDDFGRTQRQREVIFTAIGKAKELPLLEIKALVDGILEKDMVKTNLDEGEIASLLLNCIEYMNYEQQQLQIPANGTWSNATIRGSEVLSINFLKNAQLIQETVYGESNIQIGDGEGEYVNTYVPPATTPAPVVTTPPVVTTTPPAATTTPPVVTTTPPPSSIETTPSETTTPEESATTPPISDTTPDSGSDSVSSDITTDGPSSETAPPATTPPVEGSDVVTPTSSSELAAPTDEPTEL